MKRIATWCFVYVMSVLSVAQADDSTMSHLDVETLKKLPHVRSVSITKPPRLSKQIIHILNWHYVPRDAYAADIRNQDGAHVSDSEIRQKYERFLDNVETVQEQQIALLRQLIKEYGLEVVFLEGISEKDMKGFAEFVTVLRRFEPKKLASGDPIELLLLEQYRRDLLELGAAGRLLVSKELKAVRPVEDDDLLKTANPVQYNGKIVFDEKINERREDAMVARMLDGRDVAIVVLGGGHNLSDNIPENCQYVRVVLDKYSEVAQ